MIPYQLIQEPCIEQLEYKQKQALKQRNLEKKHLRQQLRIKAPEFIDLSRQQQRTRLLDLLGNQCVQCGYLDKRALQIHHVLGNGRDERLTHGSSMYYYTQLYLNIQEQPKNYMLLCANCHTIIHNNVII